jgi:hypothetical protein
MALHKKFDVERTDPDAETPSFELAGKTFNLLPKAPAGVLNRLVASVRYDDNNNQIYSNLDLCRFVEGVVQPADLDSWREVVESKDIIVDIQKLGEVVTWLTEEVYGDRPTS